MANNRGRTACHPGRSMSIGHEGKAFLWLGPGFGRSDPLFIGEETLLFPVSGLAELEPRGHGIRMERRRPGVHAYGIFFCPEKAHTPRPCSRYATHCAIP